jgi:hypothetical protein
MAKPKRSAPRPFQTIDLATLDTVSGGRIIPRKGMDPAIIQGIQTLAQAIEAIGKQMEASKQAGSQQLMQVMQQMMQARGGKPPK